ncbi:T9SS type A sorting domain-containing protein [Flavobacterium ovatum]|uniref:T9SS type A sorting domain-containing protein n=1 Tax=Flavobacterium ovatum TaxID=1928857 RepID=UPI00344D8C10
MKHRNTMTIAVFILLSSGGLQAQESSTATGGEAFGVGGTTSYSIGQLVYTTNSVTNGSIVQGVQQPYEISTILGVKETTIRLELSIYPNPTTNYLTLKTKDSSNLSYHLYDLQGKVIENKKIITTETTIKSEELPTATYLLKVIKNNKVTKTFKIIKN